MALFLNREGILTHFARIFEEAKAELIMIVPFIKLTTDVIERMKQAERNNVEILIVYRENALSPEQKDILFSFKNITLLHHPNVHAKCYLNERSLIICSMNLYDVSMKNNREMGILLDYFNEELEENKNQIGFGGSANDDGEALENAIEEIKLILNSATREKVSEGTKNNKFEFNILKNKEELTKQLIDAINLETGNKKFKLVENSHGGKDVISVNYYENVDLELQVNFIFNENNRKIAYVKRVLIHMKHPEEVKKELFKRVSPVDECEHKYYKTYWNWHTSPYLVYRDSKYKEVWNRGTDIGC